VRSSAAAGRFSTHPPLLSGLPLIKGRAGTQACIVVGPLYASEHHREDHHLHHYRCYLRESLRRMQNQWNFHAQNCVQSVSAVLGALTILPKAPPEITNHTVVY